MITTGGDGILARLKASADRLAELREEEDAEAERRDALIIEARDSGATWKATAAAGRCSISRCAAIVAAS